MPHVIFLHSALMQGRIVTRDPQQMKRLFHYEVIDVVIAMGLAGLVNAAMLVMAAKTFNERGLVHVDAIEKAYMTLQAVLGSAANTVFALSLLAAGLSSSAVGTMSGQVIMQGFLKYHIPVWLRRGLTMAPALVVIVAGWDPTRTLVLSQVVLSFGLPFAIYLLRSYIAGLPRDLIESAQVDGANDFKIFRRIILPLSFPALASFAIFQFLWVWNDLLVAIVFLGTEPDKTVLTYQLNSLLGSRGGNWEILTASAFITIIVPLIVFFSLQRYFVRGLLAGSVKGG